MYIGYKRSSISKYLGLGIYLDLRPFRLSILEGGHIMLCGLVISKQIIDIRLFGHAWIWNRGLGWNKRL